MLALRLVPKIIGLFNTWKPSNSHSYRACPMHQGELPQSQTVFNMYKSRIYRHVIYHPGHQNIFFVPSLSPAATCVNGTNVRLPNLHWMKSSN